MNVLRYTGGVTLTSLIAAIGCAEAPRDGAEEGSLGQAAAAITADDVVAAVDIETVSVPKRFNIPYTGAAQAEFPDGLPLSVGSGLRLKTDGPGRCGCGRGHDEQSSYTLVGLSDRGPNADSPNFLDAAGVNHSAKSFLVPDFTPRLVTIRVRPSTGPVVTDVVPLHSGRTKAVGLPPASLTTEVGLSDLLVAYPSSQAGIDPEGVDFDARGNAWLCEEYGPSLLKVRPATGEILERLTPARGLPALLASRQINRGFEGVAVSPAGKVYGMVQSTLDIDGKTKGTSQFIRLVEYDPKSGATRMFAYPHDVAAYKKSGDAKMGDLIALGDNQFLTIEEGKDKNGALRNIVYQIDISHATDLTGVTLSTGANVGKDLEYGTLSEVQTDIVLATKTLVVDLRAYGFTPEKAEGMTLIDDHTLIVANDQDFGASGAIEGDANSTDPTKYVVDSTGALTFNGAASSGTYAVHALAADDQKSNLFIVHLQTPFAGYCAR